MSSVTTLPTVSFRIFLLCSFVLVGRPQDLLPFLQPLRPALVLTLLALAATVFGARRNEISAVLSTPESKRYLLFFLIMVLGIPFAYHRRVAFEAIFLSYVVNVFFFVLVVCQVTSLERLKSLVWVICLCTMMYSVFGGVFHSIDGARLRLAGHMFDPNDTAYVLVSLFPVCFFLVRFDEGLLKKLVAVAAIIASIAVILETGSRGGFLALGAVLLFLFLSKTSGIATRYKILLVVVLASIFLLMGDRVDVERYLTLTELSSDYNVWDKGGRLDLWQGAIRLSLAHPLTGVGVECFGWAHYLDRVATKDYYVRYHSIHNSYLQVAAEVGLIGFGVYMLIIVRSVLTFFRMSRSHTQPRTPEMDQLSTLGGLMLLGFVGLLVAAFFLTQGFSILTTLYFALAAVMARLQAGPSTGVGATPVAAEMTAVAGWRNSGGARRSMIPHSLFHKS